MGKSRIFREFLEHMRGEKEAENSSSLKVALCRWLNERENMTKCLANITDNSYCKAYKNVLEKKS
jgi:hypothetical protein